MNTTSQSHPAIATPNAHCKVKPPNTLQCTLSYRLTSGLKDDPKAWRGVCGMRSTGKKREASGGKPEAWVRLFG